AQRLPWGKELERAAALLVLAIATAPRPAGAAEQRLGEVVVTAPSVAEPRAAEDPTAFATVIETAAAPTEVKTLTEALADAVGVQVRRLGGPGDFAFTNDLGTTANPADDRTEQRRNNAFDLGDLTARLGYRSGGPLAAVLTSDSFVKDEGVPGAGSVQARDARLRTLRQLAHLDVKLTPLGGLPLDADRLSIVPGLRWEVFRDDFPGTPRLPVAARASGVSVRDFLSPRLGLRVEPVRGLTLLANLGRYAREPNLEELFGTRGVVI